MPSNVRDGSAGTKRIATLRLPPVEVRCLAFGANGKILAAGYYDYRKDTLGRGGVLLFEVPSGKLLANHHEKLNPVDSLAFSPDGRLLATEDKEGFIILWKVPDAWRKEK